MKILYFPFLFLYSLSHTPNLIFNFIYLSLLPSEPTNLLNLFFLYKMLTFAYFSIPYLNAFLFFKYENLFMILFYFC